MALREFALNNEGIAEALRYIQTYIEENKINKKNAIQGALLAEETMLKFMEHGVEGSSFHVGCSKVLNSVRISVQAKGNAFDITDVENKNLLELDDASAQEYIQSLLFKSLRNRLSYKNKNGENCARILVKKSEHSGVILTFTAMILSIILSLLMYKFVPSGFNNALTEYVLTPFRDMYMHGLNMLVGPLVFLSIAASIASFGNLATLGRIGGKVLGLYFMTSVFAMFMVFGVDWLFVSGGDYSNLASLAGESSGVTEMASMSIKDTIVNIVPTNFVQAFLKNDLLQIIFLGIFCGIAGGMIGNYSKLVRDVFEAFNELFLTIISILAKLVPLVIFASLMITIFTTGIESLLPLARVILSLCVGLAGMVCIYCILTLIIARTNPLPLVRKYFTSTALAVFALSSSSAAMPLNMKFCKERLGISKKVYSFSIPLGATINMDGLSICTSGVVLFLAHVSGVVMTPDMYVSFFIMALLLAFGTPGVPGSGMIMIVALMKQVGVPMELIGIAIALNTILDMPLTLLNTTGDVAASFIAARTENLVDMDVYKKD